MPTCILMLNLAFFVRVIVLFKPPKPESRLALSMVESGREKVAFPWAILSLSSPTVGLEKYLKVASPVDRLNSEFLSKPDKLKLPLPI